MSQTILIVVALVLLVLIPTRRLYLAGFSTGLLFAYFLFVFLLGVLVAELRGPARYLVPVLVVAYLGPFVTARSGLDRLRGRGPRGGDGRPLRTERPAIRVISPPEDDADRQDAAERTATERTAAEMSATEMSATERTAADSPTPTDSSHARRASGAPGETS